MYTFVFVLALVGAVWAESAGCGQAPNITSGKHYITVNGKQRMFILQVPDNYDRSHAYRLVFGFHWAGGTAEDVATGQTVKKDVWSYFGLKRLANNSAVFVAPQGLNNGWPNTGGEDIMFLDAMMHTIEASLCVDEAARFATGFSYGGAMTYEVACARPKDFRAVAVLSGGGPTYHGPCNSPVPYLSVSGIGDSGHGTTRALLNKFVKLNTCKDQNPPEPKAGSLTHIRTEYQGCSQGHPVVWIAFDGGHIPAPYDGGQGDSGDKTFSPGETWKFFTRFG